MSPRALAPAPNVAGLARAALALLNDAERARSVERSVALNLAAHGHVLTEFLRAFGCDAIAGALYSLADELSGSSAAIWYARGHLAERGITADGWSVELAALAQAVADDEPDTTPGVGPEVAP